jgi:hypothetical protein
MPQGLEFGDDTTGCEHPVPDIGLNGNMPGRGSDTSRDRLDFHCLMNGN